MIVWLTFQVEPNAHKIEEHRRKYERLRKEREAKKAEIERKQKAEAQVSNDIIYVIFALQFMCPDICTFTVGYV